MKRHKKDMVPVTVWYTKEEIQKIQGLMKEFDMTRSDVLRTTLKMSKEGFKWAVKQPD